MTSPPLIVVRSAGFLAEISIQLYEHTSKFTDNIEPARDIRLNVFAILVVVDAHTDDLPSYRLDKAFPGLLKHATELDFDALDVTDHGHIPYFVILVRVLDDWKKKVHLRPIPLHSPNSDTIMHSMMAILPCTER